MIDLSLSSDEETFIANTSHDAEFASKLFGDHNRDILRPPGDGKVIILNDSDEEKKVPDDTENDSGVESVTATASSLTHGAALMAKGEIPELSDFFKKTSITDGDHQAYHERGWLTGNVISSVPEVDIPTVEGSTVICFESLLITGPGLPPSKFLVIIMGYLNCELFHFNPNAISALSTFVMLHECWLGITSDTSLLCYYYSPARYSKVVYGGIGLSLHRHHRDEYISASFKSCWKGSQERWILVHMDKPAPWGIMLLFPLIIKDKRNEPPMNDAGLKACHYIEEIHLW
jgi:hypothetical protein